ncbi:MAG: hypothetical protein FWC89_08875 [Defluviitaleaceae bacterium]|nr:hypothetical protein [Defluviitaleaceae bacterium]
MSAIVLQAESLNLPEIFAAKFRGKKVEVIESGNSIIINPVTQNITKKAWEEFQKYKGIIPYPIDEKAELATARDERYAHFD